jgi:MoaA/NifB/PqqE/SkfB family radical SAM enzyme
MDIKVFRDVLSNFIFFKPHIHLYGGEPLSHPDFPLFLQYCREYGYKPTLTTNGEYLDRFCEDIVKSPLSQLNVSVNGIISNNGTINSDLENKLKGFIKINRSKKIINLNYVLEPGTYHYTEEVLRHFNNNFKKGDFAYFTVQHFLPSTAANISEGETGFCFSRLNDLLSKIKKISLKFKLSFLPDIKLSDIKSYYNSPATLNGGCYVPWTGLSIYPDLKVTAGDLNINNIIEIWRSTELQEFRSILLRDGLPLTCNRCCQRFYY